MPVCLMGAVPLLAAAWADWRTRTIPDASVFLIAACGVMNMAVNGFPPLRALAGLLLLGAPLLLYGLLLPTGIGGGDIKLCAALGLLLGPLAGGVMLVLALLLTALYGLCRGAGAVPFAPFLLPAYAVILIWR